MTGTLFPPEFLFADRFFCAYVVALAFILGSVLGSFLNCMAWRAVHGGSVRKGRSRCTHCGHILSAAELVPVFSYLLLRGRCRHCGERVSPRYMLTELSLGLFFAAAVLRFGVSAEALRAAGLACILLSLSLIDLDSYRIPNHFIAAALLWWTVFLFFAPAGRGLSFWHRAGAALFEGVAGGAAVGGGMLLISLLFDRLTGKESLGGGDIKLFFAAGLYLGPAAGLLCVILSCVFGLVFALLRRQQRIPFGPAISSALLLCLLFGRQVVIWYMNLL
ncbi:prepilin peptidase [Lachnoclostridium sp. Marseille-P6806]|uniref:prepilin peptidase n=1 Tax=Lachnoclostridium sp. Marseille-P6806 TaxID=2364793 RepID=UPI001A93A875|nr:A24 family peptidase [Lachnoclostridium sp. Marseille-P6806]